jgi:hypothetical protein
MPTKSISSKEPVNEGLKFGFWAARKFSAPSSHSPLQQAPIRGPETHLPCAALAQSRLPCVALAPDAIAPIVDAVISRDYLPPAPPSFGTIFHWRRHQPGPSAAEQRILDGRIHQPWRGKLDKLADAPGRSAASPEHLW